MFIKKSRPSMDGGCRRFFALFMPTRANSSGVWKLKRFFYIQMMMTTKVAAIYKNIKQNQCTKRCGGTKAEVIKYKFVCIDIHRLHIHKWRRHRKMKNNISNRKKTRKQMGKPHSRYKSAAEEVNNDYAYEFHEIGKLLARNRKCYAFYAYKHYKFTNICL